MANYLLDLTFHSGADAPEDTDNGVYIVKTDREIIVHEMADIIDKANKYCNEESEDIPDGFNATYEDGVNIDTLVDGISDLMKGYGEISEIRDGSLGLRIDAVYKITQWQ